MIPLQKHFTSRAMTPRALQDPESMRFLVQSKRLLLLASRPRHSEDVTYSISCLYQG
jgi:hypothetical protein